MSLPPPTKVGEQHHGAERCASGRSRVATAHRGHVNTNKESEFVACFVMQCGQPAGTATSMACVERGSSRSMGANSDVRAQ